MFTRPTDTVAQVSQTAAPVLLFLIVNRVAGLRWAVLIATIWSIKVIIERRRKGLELGIVMPLITAAVITRGFIGIVTGSEAVYFGLGIAAKFVISSLLLGSVVLRRPLADRLAPFLLDTTPKIRSHHRFQTAMMLVTTVGAAFYAASGAIDLWLFRRNSVEGFVLLRFLASWPLSIVALAAILLIAHVQLSAIPGVASVPALAEDRMAQYWPKSDT